MNKKLTGEGRVGEGEGRGRRRARRGGGRGGERGGEEGMEGKEVRGRIPCFSTKLVSNDHGIVRTLCTTFFGVYLHCLVLICPLSFSVPHLLPIASCRIIFCQLLVLLIAVLDIREPIRGTQSLLISLRPDKKT